MRFLSYPSRIISVCCLLFMLASVPVFAQLNGSTSYNANTVPISGNYNAGFGLFTLYSNTGQANTGIGYASMYSNTSGSSNSATGRSSMFGNTTGNNNTAVGMQSLFTNTTGSSNTVVGYQALYSGTSSRNVALGYRAMYSNNTGGGNVGIGTEALYTITNGISNVAVGEWALRYMTSGVGNVALGFYALGYTTNGIYNTATGHGSLNLNTSGSFNVGNGYWALYANTTGGGNTALGYQSLYANTTGGSNTALGARADVSAGNLSNATVIGSDAIVDASNKVRVGNTLVSSIGGQVGWTIYSDERVKQNIKEDVPGMAFIGLLKPVTYNYNIAKENQLLRSKLENNSNSEIEKMKFSGFLAQAVDEAAKKINYDFSGIDKSGAIMGLRYSDFIVPMVKAMQEQQQQIDELRQMLKVNPPVTVDNIDLGGTIAELSQNAPNPVTGQTAIVYQVPVEVSKAYIIFYDAAGRKIDNHLITTRGSGILNVNAGKLKPGTYTYSLLIDGKLVDTKKIIKL